MPVVEAANPDKDASAVIADVEKRLVRMADDPPFRFVETPPEEAEAYLRRMTTFVGFSEEEVLGAERALGGVCFPAVFRAYLRRMGRARGDLFYGSDLAGLDGFEPFRATAEDLLRSSSVPESLPKDAVVFLFRQGTTCLYLLARGGFDGPVHRYTDGDACVSIASGSFAGLLEAELGLMESNHRAFHERGGYYLRIRDGATNQILPTENSKERPLDRPWQPKRWWEPWK